MTFGLVQTKKKRDVSTYILHDAFVEVDSVCLTPLLSAWHVFICTCHLRFDNIIISLWKKPVWLAVRLLMNCLWGNSVISVVVRQRKWGIAAVNTVDSLFHFLPLSSPVLWPAYWSMFLTWRTSCPSPSLVREVTLWWSGEDILKSSLLSSLFIFCLFCLLKVHLYRLCFHLLSLSLPLVSALQCTFLSSIKQEMFISAVDL